MILVADSEKPRLCNDFLINGKQPVEVSCVVDAVSQVCMASIADCCPVVTLEEEQPTSLSAEETWVEFPKEEPLEFPLLSPL